MNIDNVFRRLRGAIGNAVVWGAAWSACAAVVFAALKAGGILSQSVIWLDAIMVAGRFGLMGGIVVGAFAAFGWLTMNTTTTRRPRASST